jgi:hypothetical protein
MILPDFVLPTRSNQYWKYSGIDSPEYCRNKIWFDQYPYTIDYQYNNRGYRDVKWPENINDLKSSIWCVGDSFTVGIGSPVEHNWPNVLKTLTKTNTINVSLDGASNNWIARKTIGILKEIAPKNIIIHWSYISRREATIETTLNQLWNNLYRDSKDPSGPACPSVDDFENLPEYIKQEILTVHGGIPMVTDELRRLDVELYATNECDIKNTLDCIELVNNYNSSTNIIHSFIPEFVPHACSNVIESQASGKIIPELTRLDLARDGHHYDIKTSQYLSQQIIELLN